MSEKGTVFQKGGGGTNYEQAVGTAFTITMLINGNVPCLPSDSRITEIAFQTANRRYETDDILVIANLMSIQYRLVIQAKHNLIFSSKNDVFKQVIAGFWNDFNKPDIFNKNLDKLLIIKSGLNNSERNHIKHLLNLAKTHATENDFFSEINRIQTIKDKFSIFSEALKEIDKTLTESNVWELIKCIEILDYDFLNDPSTDKINFLNIIKLSKNKTTQLNEEEIWNSVLAFVSMLNYNGGSVTSETIQESSIHLYFDIEYITPYYSSISKLLDSSDVYFSTIKNNIAGCHISREKYYEKIIDELQENQLVFITGEPGVGKSAVAKDFIYKTFGNKGAFSFRAEQFNVIHLTILLTNLGINLSFSELLSCIALMESKIIFIDGMEKLLEGEPLNAFHQLKNIISEHPEIKIIVTARRFSVELLCQKFDINPEHTGFIAVEQFSKEDLDIVSSNFLKLKPVLHNIKIRMLLSSPKYIEFALMALNKANDDFTNIDQTEFKNILWNRLVKNDIDRTNGSPQKREDIFIGIAVKRAKYMQMFIRPDEAVDPAVVNLLENDNIIIQCNSSGTYSPAHDILEDWALINYVSRMFEKYPSPHELFYKMGNAPAIRRGFRLWVDEKISTNISSISELVHTALNDLSIEKYWSDEVLVAMLKSENCANFISEYKDTLLSNNLALLIKCIHFIRIACKENLYEEGQYQFLIPVGKIWENIIFFIEQNILLLDDIKLIVIGIISDWEAVFILNKLQNKNIEISVRNILIYYINHIETGKFDILKRDERSHIFKQIISILYNLAEVSNEYITDLLKRAYEYKEKRTDYNLFEFYNITIEYCLSGELPPSKLIKYMPDLIIETAWKELKIKQKKLTPYEKFHGIKFVERLNHFEIWGIRNDMNFSPSGIYKTPFYFMLMSNPLKALKFIVNFINYSVEFYIKSNTSEYKHDFTQIDIELNDGSIVKQWSGEVLWLAYRGISVTNHVIESLLLSVEKYLLECASQNTPSTHKIIHYIFNYVFQNSNNIMLTSVLASISIAYPRVVEDSMLPLLRLKYFFLFDLLRAAREDTTFSMIDYKIVYAQSERHEFNQLPHRKKYVRGLIDFVIFYQFKIQTINEKFILILDKLKSQDDKSDELWTRILSEMDIRNYYYKEYNSNLGGYPLAVKYDESLDKHLADISSITQKNEDTFKISKIVDNAYKTEGSIVYSQWLDCYNHYTNPKKSEKLFDKCVALATIGLRDLYSSLKTKQKKMVY